MREGLKISHKAAKATEQVGVRKAGGNRYSANETNSITKNALISDAFNPVLQFKRAAANREAGRTKAAGDLTTQINRHSGKCPGRPLSEESRAFFEPRLGQDFSGVRVHTCGDAANMCRAVDAQAFTYGNNIYFNRGKFAPHLSQGKELLAHELTHVVQQRSGLKRIMRRNNDDIITCNRDNAQACVIHLHGTEQEAFNVARDFYCQNCVNFVHLTNVEDSCRLMRFRVRGHTCCANPNELLDQRLISETAITGTTQAERALEDRRGRWVSSWDIWNGDPATEPRSRQYRGCGCDTACIDNAVVRRAGFAEARRRSALLRQAIDDCHQIQVPPQQGQEEGGTGEGGEQAPTPPRIVPILAMHGNTAAQLSICSYCPGGGQRLAVETGTLTVGTTVVRSHNTCCQASARRTPPFLNPHIADGQDTDDFILVTTQADFDAFARLGRNVVLQSQTPPQDGSASVVYSGQRYINIEAQRHSGARDHRRTEAQALHQQRAMGSEALTQFWGTTAPPLTGCPVRTGVGVNQGCVDCNTYTPSTPITPPPPALTGTQPTCSLGTGPGCQGVPAVIPAEPPPTPVTDE